MPYRFRPLTYTVGGEAYFHERPVATQQTGFSFIASVRADMPRQLAAALMFGVVSRLTTTISFLF
jgi:dipeptidase